MSEKAILVVGERSGPFESILRALDRLVEASVVRSESALGAAPLVLHERIALIVIFANSTSVRAKIDGLLWSASTAKHAIPVLVVSEEYREADALTYFRMGVADYLSARDHLDRIAAVAGRLAGLADAGPHAETDPSEVVAKRSRDPAASPLA